jgi:hypothetical protein
MTSFFSFGLRVRYLADNLRRTLWGRGRGPRRDGNGFAAAQKPVRDGFSSAFGAARHQDPFACKFTDIFGARC